MNVSLDKKKVIMAMSGGVDSSVAALLLKQAGYEVIGITLKFLEDAQGCSDRATTCCSAEDIGDARRVADQIGIPFYVLDAKDIFKKEVIDPFVLEYLAGRTPNPCIMCNDKLKFNFLLSKAFELGAYYVATGHYVQRGPSDDQKSWRLFRAKDRFKDQSYFLFTLQQRQLEHSLFPVGNLTKQALRDLARQHGLKTSEKSESQEICFVRDGNHGQFIEQYAGQTNCPPGDFVNTSGEKLGRHKGIYHYTIGQRRGTGVAEGDKVYVQSIDASSHTITMAPEEALYKDRLVADGLTWISKSPPTFEVIAQLRYRHVGAKAILSFEEDGVVQVKFAEAQRAITPGQAVVFYSGDEMLGGAWIRQIL